MARQISGIIKLDGVPLQTQVRVTDAVTGALIKATNSNAAGRYSVPDLDNKPMYVQAVPPAGRRPLMHGPVTPYLAPTIEGIKGAVKNESYSATISLETGDLTLTPPYKWSIYSGSLPAGLHLGTSTTDTNTVTGVPTSAAGTYPVGISVEDSVGVLFQTAINFVVGEVMALLHFDGNITDETGRTWTNSGATISTTSPKFGAGSALFTGAVQKITTPLSDEVSLINGSGSITAWIKRTGDASGTIYAARNESGGTKGFQLLSGTSSTVGDLLYAEIGTSSPLLRSAANALKKNTWHFIEVSKPTVSHAIMFIDGVKVDETFSMSGLVGVVSASIGSLQGPDRTQFYGQIDEFVIKKGAVGNVENYIPPSAPSDYSPTLALDLSINGSLPPATVATAYSSTTDINIQGAETPFTVTTSGDFPPGWLAAINGNHVEVTGPGVPVGDYTFTINVSDNDANTVHLPLFLRINP